VTLADSPSTTPAIDAAWRGWLPRASAALLGFSVLLSIGLADGGVFPRTWRLATLALCALAAAAVLARDRIAFVRLEWVFVGLVAALAGWTALSAAWSGYASDSLLQGERVVLYVVALVAVLVVVDRATVAYLLVGVVAAITAFSAYGLGEYLLSPPALDPFEGRLLHRPLGYANALGITAAIGIVLAAGLALALRHRLVRAGLVLSLAVLVPTLLLTSSRGAWFACVVGLGLLVRPLRFRTTIAIILAALLVAGLLAVIADDNRADYWSVAWQDYRDHPVLGAGAGTYGHYWLGHGTVGFTRTAHSLYLQSLAELGPLGLVIVVSALATPLVAARADRYATIALAAYVAFVVHAGIDWDWEMPAVTLAGLFCGAAALVASRPERSQPMRLWMRAAIVVATTTVAVGAVVRLGNGPTVPFGG
jgi:O-antigen ligase